MQPKPSVIGSVGSSSIHQTSDFGSIASVLLVTHSAGSIRSRSRPAACTDPTCCRIQYQVFCRFYQVACPTVPYLLGMKKTAHIDIRVEPAIIEKIDTWCSQQRV